MTWEGITAIVAILGVFANFIRFGKWQGAIETKVSILEKDSVTAFNKLDVISLRLEETSKLLAELNIKLEIILDGKYDKA